MDTAQIVTGRVQIDSILTLSPAPKRFLFGKAISPCADRIMKSLGRTLVHSLGANAYGQIVTVIIQVVSLPFFLSFWSMTQYGQWAILYAIPAYFIMADFGLSTAAANQMTMASAREEHAESISIFRNALAAISSLCILIGTTSAIIIALLPEQILPAAGKPVVLLLMSLALMNVISTLFDATFRANNNFALGVFLSNSGRLVEWGGGMLALFFSSSFISVALGMLIGRLIVFFTLLVTSQHLYPDYRWTVRTASYRKCRPLIKPGLGFLMLPIGNSLSIQGMTLLVGTTLGPAAAGIFNTYRTLARCMVQVIAIISKSVWPELTRLYARKDFGGLRRMFTLTRWATVGVSVTTGLIIYFMAPFILSHWTRNKVSVNPDLLAIFVSSCVLTSFWQIGMVLIAATNNHTRFAVAYAVVSALVLAGAAPFGSHGLIVFAIATLILELLLIAVTASFTKKVFRGQYA